MKRILLLTLVLMLFSCGCMSANFARSLKALGSDPATVHLRITTIYGVIELSRANPGSNTLPHAIAPDGSISVDKPK